MIETLKYQIDFVQRPPIMVFLAVASILNPYSVVLLTFVPTNTTLHELMTFFIARLCPLSNQKVYNYLALEDVSAFYGQTWRIFKLKQPRKNLVR